MNSFRARTKRIVSAAITSYAEDEADGVLITTDDRDSDVDFISPSVSDDESDSKNSDIDIVPNGSRYAKLVPVPILSACDAMDQDTAAIDSRFSEKVVDTDFENNNHCIEHSYASRQPLTETTHLVSCPKPQVTHGQGRKRKHNCVYCDVLVTNFSRHLERQHSDEIDVQKYMSMKKTDPQRKRLIDKIRKEGDFCSGETIPVQRKKGKYESKGMEDKEDEEEGEIEKSTCQLLPCAYCRGYYARKTLRRHVKRCPFNKQSDSSKRSRPQSDGHNLMANHFGPNDPLRTSGVLKTLRADDISLVAKRDKIICEVARKYIKSHKDKHLTLVARRYMRRLARLLIEVRKIENDSCLSLLNILHPSKFRAIVQASHSICGYDLLNKSFKSPTLGLQIGTLIKKAIGAAYSLEIQKNVDSPHLNILNSLKKLIDEDWASEISSEAGQNLNLNRFNKPTLLPKAEDISKMKIYLDDLIRNSKSDLSRDCRNEQAYKKLIEGTYCSLLLFNKRRVGELQRIQLDTYLKVQNNQPSGDFEKLLSPTEKILIKKLNRIVIRGKRGRGVPVLFDKMTQEGLDIALQHRNNFFEIYNPYLFGTCHSEESISGYHVFRKHVNHALGDPNKTAALTSTKLRKHLAIIAQILDMSKDDLEQLATFMGHTTKTHNEWYRLPSDIYQTAKVSKILMLVQNGGIDKYKGCNLDDLEIEEDIIETQNDSDSEEEAENMQNENSIRPEEITEKPAQKNKKKKVVKKWTPEEKKVTESFFQNHIENRIAPKKNEVLKLVESYPSLFKNRTWEGIKIYVCNKYAKK